MTKIRISGVSDLATARACAALEIDFIGLNLSHGKQGAISPVKISDYTQWLSGIEIIAELHHLDETKALRFMELLNIKHAEILIDKYVNGNNDLWYYGESKAPIVGTQVSDAYYKIALNDTAFVKILSLKSAKELKRSGVQNFDLDISLFFIEGGVDWEKVADTISELKK